MCSSDLTKFALYLKTQLKEQNTFLLFPEVPQSRILIVMHTNVRVKIGIPKYLERVFHCRYAYAKFCAVVARSVCAVLQQTSQGVLDKCSNWDKLMSEIFVQSHTGKIDVSKFQSLVRQPAVE